MDEDALYRALSTRDARFDGRFFTGVTSTGIYCRPVCRVRTPQRGNCRFFEHAAQAEQAGFRPCLRCRPELAPRDRHWSTEDAGDILVRQATAWLDQPDRGDGTASAVAQLASRLGVSDRHLRRLFEDRLGVSPLQYLLTRRLLSAKQLLADTTLPVADVALMSGFASVRRFNAAFAGRYGMNPTQMRRGGSTGASSGGSGIRLAWRPPYQAQALIGFMATRALPGIELIDPASLSLRRTLRLSARGSEHRGWLQVQLEPDAGQLVLRVSDGLVPALPWVIARVRAAFDLDADPQAIDAVLHRDFPAGDGLRVPGAFDGFELAVRAILGQQVTVAAARTLADRLARAVLGGTLTLNDGADPDREIQTLQTLPGIGPWTAHYIAMRALRWPDAWPAGDIAMHHALGLAAPGTPGARKEAEQLSQRWRPWRSYALIRAWSAPPAHPPTQKTSP